jgi:hypothetical protein
MLFGDEVGGFIGSGNIGIWGNKIRFLTGIACYCLERKIDVFWGKYQ